MKPKRLNTQRDREYARAVRNAQWKFMERCAEHDPLWFCVWNKRGMPEAKDELRDGLLTGMEKLSWMDKHPEWFLRAEWDEERYAEPIKLTAAGRQALKHKEMYDMEDVEGGLVEPGYITTPAPVAR